MHIEMAESPISPMVFSLRIYITIITVITIWLVTAD